MKPYTKEIETRMQEFYSRICEKSKRLYAGVEASKLPYGGISYIAELFDCSRDTVYKGIKELADEDTLPQGRNRKDGGGRIPVLKKEHDIDGVFLQLLKEHTAGDPMDEKVKWTNLSCANIAGLLATKGFMVSRNIVRKLLKSNDYVKRKAFKNKAAGGHVNRNAQFERIAELRAMYDAAGNPVVSVDTKKKEAIGKDRKSVV